MSLRDIFRRKKKYIGLILIAVIAFNFAFLPLIALAAKDDSSSVDTVIGFISGKALLFASSAISAILGAFFGVILTLEAKIIDYIINPNNFSLVNTPVVTLGWGITRDLANMFFILILLVIAFATVLKIQSYGIKQLLWKVVVAAILINFSLVIAGFIIDFAQILTGFFLKGITGDGFGTITTRLASGMQILNFYNPANPASIEQGIAQFGASSVAAVVGIILTLVGLVITVFVFGATVIFLIVRIIYIWGLLIFAPIVWVLWIIPETKQYFSQWWNEFIKWVFFAPIYVFMIYLSLSIFDAQGSLNPKAFWAFPAAWKDPAPGLTTVGMPSAIFQWILVIAMMFGSLIVAQKLGVEGAKAIRGATKGAAKSTALWTTKSYGRMALGARNFGASSSSSIVRGITKPIRFIGKTPGLQTLGALATGAKGGKFTAPLAKTPSRPLGWKSTPLSLLEAIAQGAVAGSGLFKKKKKGTFTEEEEGEEGEKK